MKDEDYGFKAMWWASFVFAIVVVLAMFGLCGWAIIELVQWVKTK